ncbi:MULTISPECIES: hypothetical protein [unclassified Paraburkholderia]|uniref:hypothetical protein n=1 Tax=unclassified Paraburkholderia TaxID=2615204 RepID=UPI001981C9F4|nr:MULTISPECIES: hypothetical protein [unclassified Paraburkholderia]MBN3853558.1 hypothetical protein [Paraburkholderia sp. Ac-20340]
MNDQRKRTEPPPAQNHELDEDAKVKHPRHEGGEPVATKHPHEPRSVGVQGHEDLERGLEDTDRWGGDAYQERTQNDAQANKNTRNAKRH